MSRRKTLIGIRPKSPLGSRGRDKITVFFGDKILDLESDFRKFGSVAVLRSLIRIMRASLAQIDTEMAEKYVNQRSAASSRRSVSASQLSQWSALLVLVTMTFDLLTLKLVYESHQRWGTFTLNFGTIGLRVLELFAMYATDGRTGGRTDRRTHKSNAYCPFPTGGGIIQYEYEYSCRFGSVATRWSCSTKLPYARPG